VVQVEPAKGEADSVPVCPAEGGAVGRGQFHAAQWVRPQGPNPIRGAHGLEERPGLGRDALPAWFVPWEAGGLEQDHLVSASSQEAGDRGAGGPSADDRDVALVAAQAASLSATARRR